MNNYIMHIGFTINGISRKAPNGIKTYRQLFSPGNKIIPGRWKFTFDFKTKVNQPCFPSLLGHLWSPMLVPPSPLVCLLPLSDLLWVGTLPGSVTLWPLHSVWSHSVYGSVDALTSWPPSWPFLTLPLSLVAVRERERERRYKGNNTLLCCLQFFPTRMEIEEIMQNYSHIQRFIVQRVFVYYQSKPKNNSKERKKRQKIMISEEWDVSISHILS